MVNIRGAGTRACRAETRLGAWVARNLGYCIVTGAEVAAAPVPAGVIAAMENV